MKTILVIGKNGQVGFELCRTLAPLGKVIGVDREQFNLANPSQIRSYLKESRPDFIVNAAAYTNVEKAEDEQEEAQMINGEAPGILAEEAKSLGAFLVHFSTDYVFDGKSNRPYSEEDTPNPLNVYGKTKLKGEENIRAIGGKYLILRTSWVFGLRGKNFLRTMLDSKNEEFKIVDDQIGAPTWSRLIAEATAQILAKDAGAVGIFHLTAQGETSWCNFAKKIFDLTNCKKKANPTPSEEYPSKAARPAYSILSNQKIEKSLNILLPSWEQNLKLCLETFKILS